MGKKERRRGEWNRVGRNEWGRGVGELGREMELLKKWERRDMRGWALIGLVCGAFYFLWRGDYCMCLEDLR